MANRNSMWRQFIRQGKIKDTRPRTTRKRVMGFLATVAKVLPTELRLMPGRWIEDKRMNGGKRYVDTYRAHVPVRKEKR